MFSCKICRFSRNTFFTKQLQRLLLSLNSYFQRSPEQKPVPYSAAKTYLLPQKFRSSHRRSWKKACNFIIRKSLYYCEVFKNDYYEKHLWTAASENQHVSDKFRSCSPEVFCKKGVLRNFAKFIKKQLCNCLFFNKVAGLRLFPVSFVKFLRTPFIIEQLRWLLLFSYKHDVFIIKKLQHFYHKEVLTHIKWNVMISSSLRFVESVNLIQMWKLKISPWWRTITFLWKSAYQNTEQ